MIEVFQISKLSRSPRGFLYFTLKQDVVTDDSVDTRYYHVTNAYCPQLFEAVDLKAGTYNGDEFNDWMTTVWEREVGPNVDMPMGWQSFGYDGENFSGRLALDRLEKAIARLRERIAVG